jgi:hypothetical protein
MSQDQPAPDPAPVPVFFPPRAETAADQAPGPRSRQDLWRESCVVLFIGGLIPLSSALLHLGWPDPASPRYFTYHYVWAILWSAQIAIPVLYLISVSNEPLSTFGLQPVRWVADTLAGAGTWCAAFLVYWVV